MSKEEAVHLSLSVRASAVDGSPIIEWKLGIETVLSIGPYGFDFPTRNISGPVVALLRAAMQCYDRGQEIHWKVNDFYMNMCQKITKEQLEKIEK